MNKRFLLYYSHVDHVDMCREAIKYATLFPQDIHAECIDYYNNDQIQKTPWIRQVPVLIDNVCEYGKKKKAYKQDMALQLLYQHFGALDSKNKPTTWCIQKKDASQVSQDYANQTKPKIKLHAAASRYMTQIDDSMFQMAYTSHISGPICGHSFMPVVNQTEKSKGMYIKYTSCIPKKNNDKMTSF